MTGKRFGSLFLALALAMSMTACGGETAPENPEPIPEEPNVEVIAPVDPSQPRSRSLNRNPNRSPSPSSPLPTP